MSTINDSIARFLWMAEILEVKTDDRLLEIGCGVGFAVELIAPRLSSGFITAIDRSKAALSKAVVRNDRFVKERKAELIAEELGEFAKEGKQYNKIFAFNVNLFWTQRSIWKEMEVVRKNLAPKGRFYLFYQPPSEAQFELITRTVGVNLSAHSFEVIDTVYDKAVKACCIVSR